MTGNRSDGMSASYYELPKGATELYHLIIHKDMNAQLGEIFRAAYRYGESSHSDQLRDIRKIKAYAIQEEERLLNERRQPPQIVEEYVDITQPGYIMLVFDNGQVHRASLA